MTRTERNTRGGVVVAMADRGRGEVVSGWLREAGYSVQLADDPATLADLLADRSELLLLLDSRLGGSEGQGFEACREIRARSGPTALAAFYVLMVTHADHPEQAALAIDAGADDFVHGSCSQAELLGRLRQAWTAFERSRRQAELADIDPVTGVYNRRSLNQHCERQIAWAGASGQPLSCCVLDLDLFKQINDSHGHLAGDAVLAAAARTISLACRTSDLVCRYGGDEFCLLLPGVNESQAVVMAERVRSQISELRVPFAGRLLSVRATIGVVQWHAELPSVCQLLDLADQAMLAAKHSGRDRVVRYSELEDPQLFEGGGSLALQRLGQVPAREVMTSPVVCIRHDQALREAADLLLRVRVNSAPVVDDQGLLVGIISEKDLINAAVRDDNWLAPVRSCMRTSVVCYDVETPVLKIWEFLRRVTIRRVVIVERDLPVGVLSRGGLLRWLGNWGGGTASRVDGVEVTRRAERLAAITEALAGELRRLRELGPEEIEAAALVSAATRLQEQSQALLSLSQLRHYFLPDLEGTVERCGGRGE